MPNVLKNGNLLLGCEVLGKWDTVFVLVDSERVVKAECALGMSVQEIRLFLQFGRRSPIVITIEQSHISAFRQLKGLSKDSVATAPEVFRRQHQTNFLGIPALKIKDNRACSIGGAVLSDNDLVIAICFLHQNTIERLRNVLFMVICGNEYGYFHYSGVKVSFCSNSLEIALQRIVPEWLFQHSLFYCLAFACDQLDELTDSLNFGRTHGSACR